MDNATVALAWRRLRDSKERLAWAQAVAAGVEVDRVNEAISVTGPCPACGHDFDVVLTEKELLAELDDGHRSIDAPHQPKVRIDWAGTIRFLVACHCEGEHEGRPSVITHGCGASGWLVDEPET